MTLFLTVSVTLVAVGLFLALAAISVRVLRVEQPSNEPPVAYDMAPVLARVTELEVRVEALPSLWEHERLLAKAAKDEATVQHRKAAAALRAAQNGAEEGEDGIDGVEFDEADRFLREHGGEFNGEGVQPVQEDVGGDPMDDLRRRAEAAGVTAFI